MDGRDIEVGGPISFPFGIFEGTGYGPDRNDRRTLVHIPTRRIIASLKTSRQCRALASELAPTLLRGELPDPAPVVERHVRESV